MTLNHNTLPLSHSPLSDHQARMAPPSTPSPFRFARRREHQSSSATKPPSALGHSATLTPDSRRLPSLSSSSAVQQRIGIDEIASTVQYSTFLRRQDGEADAIRDASQGSRDDPRDEGEDILPEGVQYDVAFSPSKRRKLSPSQDMDASIDLGSATTKATLSRFLPVQKPLQSHNDHDIASLASLRTSTQTGTVSARPAFLLHQPPQGAAERTEPLPDAFSPNRRSRKYIPGGMAETFQSWILEVTHSAQRGSRSTHASWTSSNGTSPSHVLLEILTVKKSVVGQQAVLLTHALDANESLSFTSDQRDGTLSVLLVFNDARQRMQPTELQAGALIEVKAPFWNIALDGDTWMVAVDWKLVS